MDIFVFERKWAGAVLGAMFPPDEGAASIDFGDGFSRIIRAAPFEAGVGLRLALLMVILAPLFMSTRVLRERGSRFHTFVGLGTESREGALGEMMKSSVYAVRQLLMALKTMGALLYARDPSMRAKMLTPKATGLISTITKKASASRAA